MSVEYSIPLISVLEVGREYLTFPFKLSQGRRSDSRYRIILATLSLFHPFLMFFGGSTYRFSIGFLTM